MLTILTCPPHILTFKNDPQPHVPGSESLTQPQLLPLDMKELEVFRYRVQDAAKSVTTKAVHEARLKDLKMELLTSKRLAEHFEVSWRVARSRRPRRSPALRHHVCV